MSRGGRYLLLLAYVALLAAPAWVTTAVIGVSLAITALRVGRWVRHRAAARPKLPENAISLGHERSGRAVIVSERELSGHGLILGASGAGKTTTLLTILTQQIQQGRPVVAIDMKGSPDFARRLGDAAAAAGRPFRLWTPDGPSHWNPLQHGNATELKDKLIATERFTEPHYQRAAERYVQTVLQVLEHAHPERPPTLDEVVRLMDPRRLPVALRGLPRSLTDRVQDYLSGLTPDQHSAIRGLQSRLAIVTESHTGRFLAPSAGGIGGSAGEPVNLRRALAGDEVVLFSLNSSRYGHLASQLGTLAVQDLISATGWRLEERAAGRQLSQATIAIDEFSGIGSDHVIALFARGREAGIAVLVATQEMADLTRAGRGVRDQVLGNTSFKLALRQDVPESAQTIAQIVGTEKRWEETRQIGGTIFGGYPGRGTRREAEQFIVHPNEIKTFETGEAVLISKLRGGKARTVRVSPSARGTPGPPRRDRDGPDRG
jgi:conjugal transfer pilus assembly protein TraD